MISLVLVLKYSTSNSNGNLVNFLLPEFKKPVTLPPVTLPKALEEPKPAPPPPVFKAEKKEPEWIALDKGKAQAKGTLSKPSITTLENGDVEVSFSYSDAPGNFREFNPENVDSLSVDLFGSWGKDVYTDTRLSKGVLKRVQVAHHKQWVRVSGIARDSKQALKVKVEHSTKSKILHLIFSKKR